LCFLFHLAFCYGQNAKIDSLLLLLKTDKPDTTQLIHLHALSLEFETIGGYDQGFNYCNRVLALADIILKSNNSKEEQTQRTAKSYKARAYSTIAAIFRDQGNYAKALNSHSKALKIRELLGEKKSIASCYNNMGNVYEIQGNYPEALKYYFTSLKIKETIDDKRGMANSFNNIGNVYNAQGNYSEALRNHLAALKIREAIGDQLGISASNNNIGNTKYEQAIREKDPMLREQEFEESLKNHLASLEIAKAIDNKRSIANSYINIGVLMFDQAGFEKNPDLKAQKLDGALKNNFSALEMRLAINDKVGESGCYLNIGGVLIKQKKYKEAEEYYLKAKGMLKEIGHKEYLKSLYSGLMVLDSAKGNFKDAYENYKLYVLYLDSLDNEETRKKTLQNQLTYDFEKKEAIAAVEHKKELESQEILAEEKSRKQRIVLVFVSCFLIFVVVFAIFIFRSLRMTRKQKNTIEAQKSLVELQKEEMEHQKGIVEEKQKEIIDSITYARRIQRSLLPTEKYIGQALKRLKKQS
jgi:tetratricopeptide (TPR) repeat protein